MAQRVHRHALVDLRRLGGGMDGAVELAGAQRVHGIEAGEEPAPGQDLALGMAHAPPRAQPLQQHRREHGVAILATLALLDTQGHALAVDVADLQRDHLAGAKPCAVGNRQCRLRLQIRRRSDQARDLLTAQHHRQRARHAHRLHLGHQLATIQRDVEEELQARDRRVQRDRRGALIDQVQLEPPQILDGAVSGERPRKAARWRTARM